jgi:hypothetical protein
MFREGGIINVWSCSRWHSQLNFYNCECNKGFIIVLTLELRWPTTIIIDSHLALRMQLQSIVNAITNCNRATLQMLIVFKMTFETNVVLVTHHYNCNFGWLQMQLQIGTTKNNISFIILFYLDSRWQTAITICICEHNHNQIYCQEVGICTGKMSTLITISCTKKTIASVMTTHGVILL